MNNSKDDEEEPTLWQALKFSNKGYAVEMNRK
jgi:hypothetical protein